MLECSWPTSQPTMELADWNKQAQKYAAALHTISTQGLSLNQVFASATASMVLFGEAYIKPSTGWTK